MVGLDSIRVEEVYDSNKLNDTERFGPFLCARCYPSCYKYTQFRQLLRKTQGEPRRVYQS